MCGIVGLYYFNQQTVDQKELIRFRDSLEHRGPDGSGLYISKDQHLGLGHRRLAILDTSPNAKQPMSYENERYWIVYNGEIYNFLEVKKELKDLGFNFKSNSDTEVILAAYNYWGNECQKKFNGMWAFAIYDTYEKTIFLSRDRFGVKPIYLIHDQNKLIFASELKSFMYLPGNLIPEFNLEVLAAMGKNIKETILKNVKQLNPGTQAKFDSAGKVIFKKWWNTSDHIEESKIDYKEQVEKFKNLFTDACRIRMRSDVPICSSLSGGLDSSSIVCTMSEIRREGSNFERHHDNNQSAFICDFIGSSDYEIYSEKKYAESIIKNSDAIPYYIDFSPDSVSPDEIKKITFFQETVGEPAIGPWRIYQAMRSYDKKVTLDGHGGDELLAGYPTHIPSAISDALIDKSYFYLNDILQIESDLDSKNQKKRRTYELIAKDYIDKIPVLYKILKSIMLRINQQESIKKNFNDFINVNISNGENVNEIGSKTFSNLNKILYQDFHYGSLQNVLQKFDRLSMAHGVEIRSPLLDYRLVSFAFSLNNNAKIGNGFTKRIFRDAMLGSMPDMVRLRKSKTGFDPMQEWYKKSVSTFIDEIINSEGFLNSSIWNGKELRKYYYENNNLMTAKKIFRFAQTYQLMESFDEVKHLS